MLKILTIDWNKDLKTGRHVSENRVVLQMFCKIVWVLSHVVFLNFVYFLNVLCGYVFVNAAGVMKLF